MPTNEITFKIHPPDGGSEVPVSLLIQSLGTLEDLVYMFAWQEEGRQLKQRFRLNAELRSKYVLKFRPPVTGSFSVSGRLASDVPDLLIEERHAHVIHTFQEFGKAIEAGDAVKVRELVQESRLRDRVLHAFRAMSPPAGRGYRYEVLNGTGAGFSLDEDVPAFVSEVLVAVVERSETQTVTGKLDAIRFNEHKLSIYYAPRSRTLECSYSDDLEVMLWENRRDLIKVRGRVVLDVAGHPQRIDDVEEITELDLSPFRVPDIQYKGDVLSPRAPLLLQPTLSDDEQLLCLEHEPWDLLVYGQTRQELSAELREHLIMLWVEYAQEDDDVLNGPAQVLKKRLLQDLKLAPHA